MAIIIPNTNVDINMVRATINYPSTDLGTLCGGVPAAAAKINEWSRYKPVNYPADVLSASVRDSLSGFKIDSVTQYIEYDPPKGGASSPYRLQDYCGYNHNSKRPSNTTLNIDIFVENPQNITNYSEFSFNFTLPQLSTIKALATDPYIQADIIAFRLDNNTCNGTIGSNKLNIDGKCAAKIEDLGLSDTGTTTIAPLITGIDLRKYGATMIGSTYRLPIEVWYGNAKAGDFNKLKIHNGDSVTITGKVISSSIVINFDAMSGNYPPVNALGSICTGDFNVSTGAYTVTNLQIKGDINHSSTGLDVYEFDRFKENGLFRIQYMVTRDYNVIAQSTDLFQTFPSTKPDTSASANLQTMKYSVIVASGFTISGLRRGDTILFRLNPD